MGDIQTPRPRDRSRRVLLVHGPYGARKASWWDRLRFTIRSILR